MSMLVVPAKARRAPAEPVLSAVAFALTWVRVPVGLVVLVSMMADRDLLGLAALTLFVGLDVVDGIIARAGEADSPSRRGLDSLVDRTTVVAFFLGAALRNWPLWPAASVMMLVNLVALPIAVVTWRRYRMVLKAPRWHRIWSMTLFLAGLLYLNKETGLAAVTGAIGALAMAICSTKLIYTHITLGRAWGTPESD